MAYDLVARLRLNDLNFTSGMRRASRSMQGLKSGAGEVIKQLGLVTGAAAGVVTAFSSVNKAIDFEAQLSSIKALTGATSKEMAQMSQLALEMGAATKYNALEAAQGIEELLKAGLTPATVQAGGLEAALNLATAGGLGLADAAEIMSTALNAYKADALKASQVSDILAGTANASATSVEELRYSLAQVSAVASGIGMSFKDTNIALGLFANNGLKGSDAGTSLKTMLSNLQPQTKAQVEAFMDLGLMARDGSVAFYDAQGNLKSLGDIAGILQNSMKGLTAQQRMARMETIFGSDAIRAANILYKEGADGVKNFNAEMSKVTALDVAKEKMNNAAGAIEQFQGAIETLQIAALTPMLPVIKEAANNVANFIENLKPEQITAWGNNIKSAFQTAITMATNIYTFISSNWGTITNVVVGLTTAIIAFKAGMAALSIIGTINALMVGFRTGTLAATAAQLGLNAAMLANPMTWVVAGIAALIAAGVLLWKNWDTVSEKMDNAWNMIKRGAASAINFLIDGINELINLINKIPGVNIPIVPKVDWGAANDAVSKATQSNIKVGTNGVQAKAYAAGLSVVPNDGPVYVHKGERILNPEEAKAYNSSSGGGVNVQIASLTVREDADIDKIAEALYMKINGALEAGA
ncbi:phage tail tape measure protein [Heyndrickxia sp. FSL K6-6286]|uniref:phage tail tape measure protein n=1 Tax=Heyndrickxia sp. FSL K6-6286 TaxID=2921510 RepID=UPI00315B2749